MNVAKFNKPDNLLDEKATGVLKNMVFEVYQTTPLEIIYNLDFNAYDFISHDNILSQRLKKLQMKYDNQYLFYYIMYFMYELLNSDANDRQDKMEKGYKNKLELTPELLVGNFEDLAFKRENLAYLRKKYMHNKHFRDQVDSRVNEFINRLTREVK